MRYRLVGGAATRVAANASCKFSWIQVVEAVLSDAGLPGEFDGFCYLHLSDFHGRVGVFSGRELAAS